MHRENHNLKFIEERLAAWKVDAPSDPHLKQRVLHRIAIGQADENSGIFSSLLPLRWLAKCPILATTLTCVALFFACTTVYLSQQKDLNVRMAENSRTYFLMINPVAHVDASSKSDFYATKEDPSLIDMLAWMRRSLDLSRDQFQALVALHAQYEDRFVALYKDLSEIQVEYQVFDNKRLNNDMIDFMELYDLLRERDTLRECSEQTSRQLIDLVLQVLTPEQAQNYLALLDTNGTTPLPTPKISQNDAGA